METQERRAVVALVCIRGVGHQTIEGLRRRVGALGPLLERPCREWWGAATWTTQAREQLAGLGSLAELADRCEARMRKTAQRVVLPGDPGYPLLLSTVPRPPPALFLRGPGAAAPHRPRVAMVGTRRPDGGFERRARGLAQAMAAAGMGVVSGAALGIDRACHLGALDAGGETWAFMGAGLDQLDAAQAALWPAFESGGGTFFSQFPPGSRGERGTFPQRNRCIAGASDAVIVVRAPSRSGSLQTAWHARELRRAVLAVPGDHDIPAAAGCNQLLAERQAELCLGVKDVVRVLGVSPLAGADGGEAGAAPPPAEALPVLEALDRGPMDFDQLLGEAGRSGPGELRRTLTRLEVAGLVVNSGSGLWARTGSARASDVDGSGRGH